MSMTSQQLRDSARGENCTLRLVGQCNFNPETTVLCHLPCGQKGIGMKSPDNMAIFACSGCHAFLDGPKRWEIPAFDMLRALAETQGIWIRRGLMTIKGAKP